MAFSELSDFSAPSDVKVRTLQMQFNAHVVIRIVAMLAVTMCCSGRAGVSLLNDGRFIYSNGSWANPAFDGIDPLTGQEIWETQSGAWNLTNVPSPVFGLFEAALDGVGLHSDYWTSQDSEIGSDVFTAEGALHLHLSGGNPDDNTFYLHEQAVAGSFFYIRFELPSSESYSLTGRTDVSGESYSGDTGILLRQPGAGTLFAVTNSAFTASGMLSPGVYEIACWADAATGPLYRGESAMVDGFYSFTFHVQSVPEANSAELLFCGSLICLGFWGRFRPLP